MIEPLDVRHLPYMPLYLERLRRSKAWLRCKRRPEIAFYLMNLWMRAYHEFPAGSVENDEDVLADAAMCDPDDWPKVRADVLRGWIEQDGRLYHPVVLEVATEALARLRGKKERTEAARKTLAELRAKGQSSLDLCEASVTASVTDDEGKGEEEGKTENPHAAHSTTSREPGRGGGGVSLEDRLREASRLIGAKASALRKVGPIEALIAEGVSLERVILPCLRSLSADGPPDARSWAYFVDPILRWAGSVQPASAVSQVVSVWVAADSPAGRAWEEHERGRGREVRWIVGQRSGRGRGMPAPWPPGHANATEAAA